MDSAVQWEQSCHLEVLDLDLDRLDLDHLDLDLLDLAQVARADA